MQHAAESAIELHEPHASHLDFAAFNGGHPLFTNCCKLANPKVWTVWFPTGLRI
jgi:hypothetical protein